MTAEEKSVVVKIIRRETGCGMMEASSLIDQLLSELKKRPGIIVMDNPASPKLTIEWKRKYDTRR